MQNNELHFQNALLFEVLEDVIDFLKQWSSIINPTTAKALHFPSIVSKHTIQLWAIENLHFFSLNRDILNCRNGDAEGRVVTNGYKQTNGNGVIHSPLPPDGMYHVSENGHGLMDHNGSATHLAAPLTDKGSLYR